MSVLVWYESSNVLCRGLFRTGVINKFRNIMVDNFMALLEYVSGIEGTLGFSFFASPVESPLPLFGKVMPIH